MRSDFRDRRSEDSLLRAKAATAAMRDQKSKGRIVVAVVCLLIALSHAAKSQDTNKTPAPQPKPKPKAARVHASPKPQQQQQPSVARAPVNVRPSYADALRQYRHERHDRIWWKRHFTTIVLVAGGYYYWNAGYWFPAWGYDPVYQYYDYDGPIYTYGNLLPDQVIINVQRALQEEGYYSGGLTGSLSSATRQAIANYQQDAGLIVTGVVDAPTVAALGLE